VRRGETGWRGAVDCFASSSCRLSCTLVAQWTEPHPAPWLILTDLPPDVAQAAWYGMRAWIESGFKDCTRGGWGWHQTKMTDPARASRLWLVMAVATFAVVRAGAAAESGLEAVTWDGVPDLAPLRPRCTRPRLLRCCRRGGVLLLAALVRGHRLPRGRCLPAPWPVSPRPVAGVSPPRGRPSCRCRPLPPFPAWPDVPTRPSVAVCCFCARPTLKREGGGG